MFMCYCRPQKKERDECFAIELGECDGGAELGKIRKTIVTIVNDDGKWDCFNLLRQSYMLIA